MEAPGSASRTYQHSVLPSLPCSCSRAYASSGCTCTDNLSFASRNFASKGKRLPKIAITCSPSSRGPNSSTSEPSVLPVYGLFWATVSNSVYHDSPIGILPGGSCFQPSRSNCRPPQIVSCNDAASLIGCNCCTNPPGRLSLQLRI